MDPIANPFSPGAGSPPPELVGRDSVLERARTLIGRLAAGRSEKSIILTGLRGVGKTVLLLEIERIVIGAHHKSIMVEAHEGQHIGELLAAPLRRVLFDLDRGARIGNKAKRALAVLRSFISAVKLRVGELDIGLDIEPERGSADSGILPEDLTSLFEAVGEAAQEAGTVVALLIDELQYLEGLQFEALIRAMHRVQQRSLPFALAGAGLPTVPGLAGEAKSYAERLFAFPDVGPLSREDTHLALAEPTKAVGVEFLPEATAEIHERTQGYPYFVQEWGYQAWNSAPGSPIDLELVLRSTDLVVTRLDQNFFRVRFERLTPSEKRLLRAMAELGSGPYKTGDVAAALGYSTSSRISPVRMSLLRKGMIYSPSHGELAFTVPLFDLFMKRAVPHIED